MNTTSNELSKWSAFNIERAKYAVWLLAFATFFSQASTSDAAPKHLQSLPSNALSKVDLKQTAFAEDDLLLSLSTNAQTQSKRGTMIVPIGEKSVIIDIDSPQRLNASHHSVSQMFKNDSTDYHLIYTQGQTTGMGELFADGEHWYFELKDGVVWSANITQSALAPGIYENDVVHRDGGAVFPNYSDTKSNSRSVNNVSDQQSNTVVDILLLYTPNIVEQYPGEMSETLLRQLVAKANQTFVDSDIQVQLRLVGTEFVNYNKPSNFFALQDLDFAIDGDDITVPDPSLANIGELRNNLGADIVAMIRTHDLNEREVCGVAYFPTEESDVLINISNVGISGGSNCLNTFTHEIGHNFGAGHQQVDDFSVGALPFSGALVVPGQYNTIMSAIGTGDVNRDFKLPLFSNPNTVCGGALCGDANTADNARTIAEFAASNAALRDQVIAGSVEAPLPSTRDADGDGVDDSADSFPYLATETSDTDGDGVGDNTDAFVNDANEAIDTDNDGIGNNSDSDDDNDTFIDELDDLPLDPQDSVDADADSFGISRDALDNNFQEQFDADNDGIGDREDRDDDNDGVDDFWPLPTLSQSDVLVVSAGNDRILRFDGQSGEFKDTLLQMDEGSLSFRSDLIASINQQLFFIAFSDVYQYDMQRNSMHIAIDRSQMATNFPVHLLHNNDQLFVGHGLGTSYIDRFSLTEVGNQLSSFVSSPEVYRDFVFVDETTAYVLARDTNLIYRYDPNSSNTIIDEIFASQGLNRPEHMVLDNQGQLYVLNAQSKDVSRFDTEGNFLGTFIQAGTGGLGTPSCLTIGPDEHLYICSRSTNQILKFNGVTGAFDSVFIDANEGELSDPVSIQFVSQAADEFPYDPNHDSDSDGVNNIDDDLPLDATETIDTDSDGIGNNSDEDDDNDGMPDSFELQFGFDALDPEDANLDADGDGVSNVAEFNNSTDPLVANTPVEPEQPSGSSGGGALGGLTLLILGTIGWRRRVAARCVVSVAK